MVNIVARCGLQASEHDGVDLDDLADGARDQVEQAVTYRLVHGALGAGSDVNTQLLLHYGMSNSFTDGDMEIL